MQVFNNISEISKKYNIIFDLPNKKYNIYILNVFNGNLSFVTKNDSYLLHIAGLYYECVKIDYNKMKEYYLQAIKLKNSNAMNNLGIYYKNIEKDYDKMKEYYLQAIELKHSGAMHNLGYYYQTIEIDYDKMKQYYLQAIEFENSDAINNLSSYFKSNIEQLYYILISIENKNDLINNKIIELLNLPKINTFNNKINYSIENNIIRDCSICMENNKLNICFNCMHFVCVDCYLKLDKCSYCKCIK